MDMRAQGLELKQVDEQFAGALECNGGALGPVSAVVAPNEMGRGKGGGGSFPLWPRDPLLACSCFTCRCLEGATGDVAGRIDVMRNMTSSCDCVIG